MYFMTYHIYVDNIRKLTSRAYPVFFLSSLSHFIRFYMYYIVVTLLNIIHFASSIQCGFIVIQLIKLVAHMLAYCNAIVVITQYAYRTHRPKHNSM